MSRLCLKISMSLDGFVAGPEQSVENPLGIGGMQLHEWVFALKSWREPHGLEGGTVDTPSDAVVRESTTNIGATIMGRNMFGGHPGNWSATNPWNGWWDENPPFHHPVFVITHHPRETLVLEGNNSFTFVTVGIESALTQARAAAGDLNISLAGGANVAQQFLKAGLVDEMEINLVPVLLGSGARLFDGTGTGMHGLQLARTVAAANVTHLKYSRP